MPKFVRHILMDSNRRSLCEVGSRRREKNPNSRAKQHRANELPPGFPLPIRWGEGHGEGFVHSQTDANPGMESRLQPALLAGNLPLRKWLLFLSRILLLALLF